VVVEYESDNFESTLADVGGVDVADTDVVDADDIGDNACGNSNPKPKLARFRLTVLAAEELERERI
jgi:hypothetical protein